MIQWTWSSTRRRSPSWRRDHLFDLPPHHLPPDAGNPECSFVWSNGDTAQVTLADAYGTYVTITTPFECSIDDEVPTGNTAPAHCMFPNTFTPMVMA